MSQVMIEDIVVTNITARLIARAGFVSLEMAIKEHKPKKRERMTLKRNTAEIKMVKNCARLTPLFLSLPSPSYILGRAGLISFYFLKY
jgi:hypothetical protein